MVFLESQIEAKVSGSVNQDGNFKMNMDRLFCSFAFDVSGWYLVGSVRLELTVSKI